MTTTRIIVFAICLTVADAAAAAAQPVDPKAYLDVNIAGQTQSTTVSTSSTFSLFGENGGNQLESDCRRRADVRRWRRLSRPQGLHDRRRGFQVHACAGRYGPGDDSGSHCVQFVLGAVSDTEAQTDGAGNQRQARVSGASQRQHGGRDLGRPVIRSAAARRLQVGAW